MTDIQYSMVLDNVAMFRNLQANAVPWHLTFSSGDVTIRDTITVGNPNLSYAWDPISRGYGASASRNWQENWTAAPVTDQASLKRLTNLYAILADPRQAGWIKEGPANSVDVVASGTFRETHVYVLRHDLPRLTHYTIQALADASPAGLPQPYYTAGPTQTIR